VFKARTEKKDVQIYFIYILVN